MKAILFLLISLTVSLKLEAQQFVVEMKDNTEILNQENCYRITQDSLIITARSDYGRTIVNYLSRPLSKKESKRFSKFIHSFPADSLATNYFNEYTNLKFIDAEHSPKVLEVKIFKDGITYNSKATNAYVRLYSRLIGAINILVPQEIRIKLDSANFNAFY
jgi:hypothetical protein